MPEVAVRLLGTAVVTKDGEAIQIPRRRVRGLLAEAQTELRQRYAALLLRRCEESAAAGDLVHDLAIINISLHEARDPERVVARALAALKPGGTLMVSEFPFPESIEACRSLPAQIMCGIQFFEAHIGCQLLPTVRFVELLNAAGFRDVAAIDVTPVHVVVHGTR